VQEFKSSKEQKCEISKARRFDNAAVKGTRIHEASILRGKGAENFFASVQKNESR